MKARSSKSQDELGDALRELPRAEASIGFRRRVLNRLEEERLRRVAWRPVYVAVIALRWRRGSMSRLQRAYFSLTAAAVLSFFYFLVQYNLLGYHY